MSFNAQITNWAIKLKVEPVKDSAKRVAITSFPHLHPARFYSSLRVERRGSREGWQQLDSAELRRLFWQKRARKNVRLQC